MKKVMWNYAEKSRSLALENSYLSEHKKELICITVLVVYSALDDALKDYFIVFFFSVCIDCLHQDGQ